MSVKKAVNGQTLRLHVMHTCVPRAALDKENSGKGELQFSWESDFTPCGLTLAQVAIPN